MATNPTNQSPARHAGPPRRSFDDMQKKDQRTIIISTPFTGKMAHQLIAFDNIMSRIAQDYTRGQINAEQFMQAQKEADKLVKMFESEMNNLRNRTKERSRRHRPKAKPPRTLSALPGSAAAPSAAPATAPTAGQASKPDDGSAGAPTANAGTKKTKPAKPAAKNAASKNTDAGAGIAAAS